MSMTEHTSPVHPYRIHALIDMLYGQIGPRRVAVVWFGFSFVRGLFRGYSAWFAVLAGMKINGWSGLRPGRGDPRITSK